MRKKEKMKWKDIQKEVKNMEGKKPKSDHAVRNAMARVDIAGGRGVATTKYKNCGRACTPKAARKHTVAQSHRGAQAQ